MQVDKLKHALQAALAELQKRGFDAATFDWDTLQFSSSAQPQAHVPPPADTADTEHAKHNGVAAKRPILSGSLAHLRESLAGTQVRQMLSRLLPSICYAQPLAA